jgi:hypothetical protein
LAAVCRYGDLTTVLQGRRVTSGGPPPSRGATPAGAGVGVQGHGPVLPVALAHRDQAVVGVDAGAHAGLADVRRFVGSSRVQEL